MEMENEKQETQEKKQEIKQKTEEKIVAEHAETKTEAAKTEQKAPETAKEKKKESKEKSKIKKTEAVVNGKDLGISTKHAMAICRAIRGRKIDNALAILEQVMQFKKPLKMKGEIPHRHGKIMSGRYPIKACKEFTRLLKQLAANAAVNEIDLDKARISEAKANLASRPYKRGGSEKFKRTHVTLKLKVKEIKQGEKK